VYSYKGIRVEVLPGVFHPGFFFSTKLLLRHLSLTPLKGRALLELGAGSGLISLFAARMGARVTATDINPLSIRCLEANRAINSLPVEVILSDLFQHIPPRPFDVVAVNPPYYRKQPVTDADHAWFCGPNGEYFEGFFDGLGPYVHDRSDIWMVLCDGCDLEMIRGLAERHGWVLREVYAGRNLLEKNFIFRIEAANRAASRADGILSP
jgi:release factor glutamine methyltransferase